MGSPAFMLLTAELMVVSQLLLVAASWGAVQLQLLAPAYYFSHCTVGFSGVLFGYKTVATWLLPQQAGSISGIPVPSKVKCSSSCGTKGLAALHRRNTARRAACCHSQLGWAACRRTRPLSPKAKHSWCRAEDAMPTHAVPACSWSAGQSCCSYSWRTRKPPSWGTSAGFWQVLSPCSLHAPAPSWEESHVVA